MPPAPTYTMSEEDQFEFINKFMTPDSDSTTVHTKDQPNPQSLSDFLVQVSQIMYEEYQCEEYDQLVLMELDQPYTVRVRYYNINQKEFQIVTFYETLDEV